jgi:hypothetical protein
MAGQLVVVTVPDAEDLGVSFDPLKQNAKTEVGTVRPIVVTALINREMAIRARKKAREMRQQAAGKPPEPIVLKRKLTDRETTNVMADLLIKEWEVYHRYFPLKTLQDYLDDRTGRVLEEAMLQGRPLDRDAVRQAVGNLLQEHKREQGLE